MCGTAINNILPVKDQFYDKELELPDYDFYSKNPVEDAKELAVLIMQKHQRRILIDITDGATHYHANWMEQYPKWSEQHKKVASIDRHIFYKAKTRNRR